MACIGMTNLTITQPFTVDVTRLVAPANSLISIAFTAQWRERTSRIEDSSGARTLITTHRERDIYPRRGIHHVS